MPWAAILSTAKSSSAKRTIFSRCGPLFGSEKKAWYLEKYETHLQNRMHRPHMHVVWHVVVQEFDSSKEMVHRKMHLFVEVCPTI